MTVSQKKKSNVLCEFDRLNRKGHIRVCYRRAKFHITIVKDGLDRLLPICNKCMSIRGCKNGDTIIVGNNDD